MAGDEERSECCSRCHGQGDVGGDVLPICLPHGVQGGITGARADTGDTSDGAHDG